MFKIKVEDELYLEIVNSFRTEEIFEVAQKNYGRLKRWLLWIDGATIDSMNEFYNNMLNKFAKKMAIPAFIIYKDSYIGSIDIVVKKGYGANYGEIGYWIDKDYEKRGIVTKCASKLINLAFNYLDIKSIVIRCANANSNSCNVAKRLGFKLDGVLRGQVLVDSKEYNLNYYTLLKDEWNNKNLL